ELDARIMLAIYLLENGNKVFLGHKSEINNIALNSSNAIYISKSCALIDYSFLKKLKERNFYILVIDEEAIVHQSEATHLKSRFADESLSILDRYFAWGEYDASMIKRYFPRFYHKVTLTGNPRIDILKKSLRPYLDKSVKSIKARFGDYIMIPSSFAMCNHFYERGPRLKWRESLGMISNDSDRIFYTKYYEHFDAIFKIFLKDIKRLAESFPTLNFVFRPHPSENKNTLINAFKDIKNVHIVYEESVLPWLLASKFVIHNGCTTAIESFLLDKHIISYRPFLDDRYDLELPNSISLQVFNYEELFKEVKKSISKEFDLSYRFKSKKILEKYLHNAYSGENYAPLKIIEEINKFKFIYTKVAIKSYIFSFLSKIYSNALKIIIYLLKPIKNFIFKKKTKSNYKMQKFPGLNIYDLQSRLNTLAPLLGKDSKNYIIKKIKKNSFILSTNKKL
ncbi:hypothetical protein OAZ97_01505, partial [Prochlorococcus sp. AH-736-E15]|nr:hypothetical protein [Prochlorococcus sp. AH-736-E15]